MAQKVLLSEGGRAFRAELWETPEFKGQVEKREPEKKCTERQEPEAGQGLGVGDLDPESGEHFRK